MSGRRHPLKFYPDPRSLQFFREGFIYLHDNMEVREGIQLGVAWITHH
jgi:hypothetical protein